MIETGGERGSGRSVLVVRHDEDDINDILMLRNTTEGKTSSFKHRRIFNTLYAQYRCRWYYLERIPRL